MNEATKATAWMMVEANAPMQERQLDSHNPPPGEMTVAVAGCGVCHTDLSFLYSGVQTRHELPLALGHEISGVVAAVGKDVDTSWVGKSVIVPAVLSCGECEDCRKGERRICKAQVMPGNDRHGGYATHVTVPARYVCEVPASLLESHELWELSIVSDAVTTPFQAVRRAGVQAGDLAVFIGAGGIGVHGIQIARAEGATVIALDIDPAKLEVAGAHGAAAVIDVSGLDVKGIRNAVREETRQFDAPRTRWKIFETSGTKPGQEAAFSLINHGATLSVVGFTMAKLELRLSNLMAFDARAQGNWGCDPELYTEVLQWIAEGRIHVKPFVEKRALSEINQVFEEAHAGRLRKRVVLCP